MIKRNCAQNVVPRRGEKFNSFGLLRCPCWSIVKMWFFYIGKFIAHFLKCVCFENCDGFFVQGFEQHRAKDREKWSWVKNAWGHGRSLFGEERVNNSVPPFRGIGRLSSWSNFSVSYSYALLLQLSITDAWMLLNLQSRTPRLLSFRDEPTLRRFCTHCGPMFFNSC